MDTLNTNIQWYAFILCTHACMHHYESSLTRWEILLRNVVRVVRRKLVARQAKGTRPKFGTKVDLTIRIQDCVTRRTFNGIIRQGLWRSTMRRELLKRRVESPKGSHRSRGLQPIARPTMKGQARPAHLFGRGNVPSTFHG